MHLRQLIRYECNDTFDINIDDIKSRDDTIGEGSFGKVYKFNYRGNSYILKEIKAGMKHEGLLIREIINHSMANTSKYVCHIECIKYPHDYSKLYIIQEYCGISLSSKLDTDYTEVEATKWSEQLMRGVLDIHNVGVVHLDIKPDNLVVDRSGNLKIIDFGISLHKEQYLARDYRGVAGTPSFIPTRSIGNNRVDYRNDSYAVGKTLELIWKKFDTNEKIERIVDNFTGHYNEILDMTWGLYILLDRPLPTNHKQMIEDNRYKLEDSLEDLISLDSFETKVKIEISADSFKLTGSKESTKNLSGIIIDTDNLDHIFAIRHVYSVYTRMGANLSPEIIAKYGRIIKD
jgi:serine/threonine protein kinase